MLRNHLKITLRTLARQKGSTIINVAGLAIAFASAALIYLFVATESSYDHFHAAEDRIYRVTYEEVNTPAQRHLATVSPPMGPALVETYPEIVDFVRLRDGDQALFERGDRRFYERDFFYADSAFFGLFSFPLERGDPATALAAANTVVLTPATARKYFGEADPLGQRLTMDSDTELTVTGVLAEPPGPSHLRFDLLVSFATFRVPFGYPVTLESWEWISFHTYVRIADGAESAVVEAKFPAFLQAHFDEERAASVRLRLQPVTDIYFGEPWHPSMASGNVAYVYGLSGIAVLILLLAGFNYVNLSTVQAIQRGREVGVRKVLGAGRGQLIRQFIGESVLVALISLVMALAGVRLLAYGLQRFLGWVPSFEAVAASSFWLGLLGMAVLIGVAAGIYPAFVLSGFRPASVLKGDLRAGFADGAFRRLLVTLQFAIAIALIAASLIVMRQMEYVRSKPLGFEQEGVVALHMPGLDLLQRYPALKTALLQNPNVVAVTKGGHLFDGDQGSVPILPEGGEDLSPRAMNIYGLHFDFLETLGIEVIEGRAPSEAFPTDSAEAIVLNRTAARILAETVPGWDDPLRNRMQIGGIMEGRVVGVVEDFHFASLHTEIGPLVMFFPRTAVDQVIVRVRPGALAPMLASLEHDWQRVAPEHPFTPTFLDDHIAQLYRADQRFARLVAVFSLLTILVACLGLYGLVSYVIRLRTKEIGVRKVLGASVPGLVVLLSRQFLLHVLVANVMAWPLAYFGMRQWLSNFAYHAEPGIGMFVLAGCLTLALAWLTMSYQSIRAALADPVKSLRYE